MIGEYEQSMNQVEKSSILTLPIFQVVARVLFLRLLPRRRVYLSGLSGPRFPGEAGRRAMIAQAPWGRRRRYLM